MTMAVFPPLSSYALGIAFLVVVSVLWTVCSMLVQHLYQDMEFDSPFLIVYIGTSLFSVFLPLRLGYERWGRRCGGVDDDGGDDGGGAGVVVIPWKNDATKTGTGLVPLENDRLHDRDRHSTESELQDVGSHSASPDHDDDYSFSVNYCEPTPPPSTRSPGPTDPSYILSHLDHIAMASRVAPLWFLSNYFYALSLKWTTISSSTVLASMGSLFAFLFATCSRYGDERATRWKILGVALCFLGGAATAWTDAGADARGGDADGDDGHAGAGGGAEARWRYVWGSLAAFRLPLGDLAGFFSAVGYGAYTVLIRHLCPQDEDRMSMQLMFGYIGLWNMVVLLPIAVWAAASSDDDNGGPDIPAESPPEQESQSPLDDVTSGAVHTTLTWSLLLWLILKGLLDNVLSDYLWARAVVLTSATVASVGVGLTIPMAFAADWLMGNAKDVRAGEVWGAVLVLLSFVFVNLDVSVEARAEDDKTIAARRAQEEGDLS